MAKNILNETDLRNVIIGATVVGAGGGGSPSGGLDLLEIYKRNNPGKPVELELIDPKVWRKARMPLLLPAWVLLVH